VAATVGFSLVLKGAQGIQWKRLINIGSDRLQSVCKVPCAAISWVASPVLAGTFATAIYFVLKFAIFERANQLDAAMRFLPFAFCFTVTINSFTIIYEGSRCRAGVHYGSPIVGRVQIYILIN
jgi:phosphate/sulfate permease